MDVAGLGRIRVVAANTFRETIRERVLYNLVFFAILMTVCGLVLRQISIRQDEKIIKDIGLASMDLFGTLIAVFMGVGLVSKEIERRSLYPLLAKPLSRDELLLGKFFGLGLTLLVNVSAMTMGLFLTLRATRASLSPLLLQAVYPIYLGLLLTLAIALFFSTVTSSVLASVGTVCLVLAGRFADVIHNMREVAPGAPSWLTQFLYFALPNFRNFDFKNQVVHGEAVAAGQLLGVTAYAAVYVTMVLMLAVSSFRGKDF